MAIPRVSRSVSLVLAALLTTVLLPLALAPAPASAATRLPGRSGAESSIMKTIRTLINAERRQHGLRPVSRNADLENSARLHDVNMARANELSHQLTGEPDFGRRIKNAGYRWTWAGENIAWNSRMTRAGVVQLQKIMYGEHAPNNGHRLNILNRHFRNVGVDVYFDRAHHKVWLTTDFGNR